MAKSGTAINTATTPRAQTTFDHTTTYILYHSSEQGPVPFYVGETIHPDVRYKDHLRSFRNGERKEAYDYLRARSLDQFEIEVVPDRTEAQLVEELTKLGYRLYNANKGIRQAAKRTNWKRDNDAALQRVELAERAKHRKILHNSAQQLSKSELVRQRITGTLPSADEILQASWTACPPEMLGAAIGRTADSAEYCRFGDISIYRAYRDKDKRNALCVRRRDGATLALDGGWCKATLEAWADYLQRTWNSPEAVWKASAAA